MAQHAYTVKELEDVIRTLIRENYEKNYERCLAHGMAKFSIAPTTHQVAERIGRWTSQTNISLNKAMEKSRIIEKIPTPGGFNRWWLTWAEEELTGVY